MLMVGIAIDLSIWAYVNNNASKALDNSAVIYASALKGIGTKPQATAVYQSNVKNIRGFLDCPPTLTCGVIKVDSETASEVTLSVTEGVNFVFIPSLINMVPESSQQLKNLKETLGQVTIKSTAQIK